MTPEQIVNQKDLLGLFVACPDRVVRFQS